MFLRELCQNGEYLGSILDSSPVHVLRELQVTGKAPEDKIFTVEGVGGWLSEEESHGLDVILRMGVAWGAGT